MLLFILFVAGTLIFDALVLGMKTQIRQLSIHTYLTRSGIAPASSRIRLVPHVFLLILAVFFLVLYLH